MLLQRSQQESTFTLNVSMLNTVMKEMREWKKKEVYEERTDGPRNEWKNEPYVAWTYIAI